MAELTILQFFLLSLASLFVIINPLTTSFMFASLLPFAKEREKKSVARKAVFVAVGVLVSFMLFGTLIFSLFSITIEAFRIAGGLILFGIAMKTLKSGTQHDEEHHQGNEMDSENLAIIPLAIPFISGPGAIATTMVLSSEISVWWDYFILLTAILLIAVACYFAMTNSNRLVDFFGKTGKMIMAKIFGLILAVIAVQFIINGVVDVMPLILN